MSRIADIGSLLLTEARRAPRLDVDRERELVALYRDGDHAAFGHLIIANVRLAISRARALRGYGLQEDDLVQEGIVGLLEAAARFDVEKGIRFAAYASWWIKSTTMEFVLRNWSIVRTAMSADQSRLFFKLRRLKARLLRDPSIDPAAVRTAIAAAARVPVREVEVMEARLSGDVCLNAPAPWDEDGEAEIGDNLADTASLLNDVASDIDQDQREMALRAALGTLDEREQLVVRERWLVDDVAPLTALAEFLGVTAQAVKRIELAAIAKLQSAVFSHPGGFAVAT